MIPKHQIRLFLFGALLVACGFVFTPVATAHVAGTVINNSTWLNDESTVPPQWHVAPDEGTVSNAHGRVIVALLDLVDPTDPQVVTKQYLVPQSATNSPALLPIAMGANGIYTLGGGDLAPGKFRVIAWVDGNENGRWDEGEPVGTEEVTLSGNANGTSDADGITVRIEDDSDDDGMEDWWESHWFKDEEGDGTLDQTGNMDYDNDGLTNSEEYDLINLTAMYVEPNNWDTDDDGMDDAWETFYGLDPTSDVGNDGRFGDPDLDTIINYDEYMGPDGIGWRSGSSGIADFTTSKDAMNPVLVDSDHDGVDDGDEFLWDLTHPTHSMSSTNFYPRSMEMSVNASAGVTITDPSDTSNGDGIYSFGNRGGTVEFWIRPGTDGDGIIYGFAAVPAGVPNFRISLEDYRPKMEILSGANVMATVGGVGADGSVQQLDPDVWTHVACVIAPNNNSLNIYIDGILLIAKETLIKPDFVLGSPVICQGFTDGYIDELRIWNYPRPSADIEYWSDRYYPAPGYARQWATRESGTIAQMYKYSAPQPLLGYFRFDDGGSFVENFAFINYGLYPNATVYYLSPVASAAVTTDQAVPMVGSDDADGDGLPEWWVELHNLEKYREYYTSAYGPNVVVCPDDSSKIEGFEYYRSFVGYASIGTDKAWQEDGGEVYHDPKTRPDFYDGDHSSFTRYVYLFAQPVECPLEVFTPGMSETIIYVNGTKVTTAGDEANSMQSYDIAQYMRVGRNMIHVECESLVEERLSVADYDIDDYWAYNRERSGSAIGCDDKPYKFKIAVGKFDARLDCNGVAAIVRGDESRSDPRSVWHCQIWSSFYEEISDIPHPDQEHRAVPENQDYGLPLNAERDNNPLDPDTADDNLDAIYEYICGTNPRDRDSNNNGVGDGDEDFDSDGLVNREEQSFGSDPWLADTDDDGLVDGADVGGSGHPAQSLSPQNNLGIHLGGTQTDFLTFPKEQRFVLSKWTGESWIKPDSDEADGGIILQRSVSSNAVNYEIGLTAANIPYVRYVSIGGAEVRAEGSVPVVSDGSTWTHLAASYYDRDLILYVNGTNIASTTGVAFPASDAGGPIVQHIGRGFKGCIDEFRLWKDNRSASEIVNNRDEVLTGLENDLVAYYRFDDSTSYTNLPPVVGTSANNGTNGANTTVAWTWGQVEDNVLKYSSDWQYQWKHAASFNGDVNFTIDHIITGPPRLQVFIQTDDAVDAGAQWSHNGGAAWNDSGYLETRLSAGGYDINFNEIDGWITPSTTNITLIRGESTIITSRYVKTATITVIIDNNSDVKSHATWSLDGGITRQGTGTKIEGLEPGVGYDIIFSDISDEVPGWDRPATIQDVILLEGEDRTITASYTPVRGSLQITFTPDDAPAAGRWQVSGDTNWYGSGQIVTNLSYGEHDVIYNTVQWWQEPADEIINLDSSALVYESREWTKLPEPSSITTYINPAAAVSAGAVWQMNGLTYNSGDSVVVEAGDHTVSFSDIDGWLTPMDVVANAANISVTVTGAYYRVSVLGEKGTAGVPGNLLNPRGVSVDEDIIYVADTDNNQIQTYNRKTGIWNIIGGEFSQPFAINPDADGNLWIADTGNHRIQRKDAATGLWTIFGTHGNGVGQFNAPYDVVVDLQGNIYVADHHNSRIQKMTPSGQWSVLIGPGDGNSKVRYPTALHLGLDGMLYVSDSNPSSGLVQVKSFTRDGTQLYVWDWADSDARTFGTTLMADGSLLVADTEMDIVRQFTSNWSDLISKGVLLNPHDVASDTWGDMYIADSGNNRILHMPAIDDDGNGIPDIFEGAPFGSGIGPLMKLSDTSQSFSPTGGANSFNVIGNVSWTASSDSAWVVITDGASGVLSGPVTYTVDANLLALSRSATITVIGGGLVSTHTIYQPVSSVGNDFNGDRRSDLAVLDQATGRWFIRDMNGSTIGFSINWGWAGVEGVAGDYDGDGVDDLAVFDDASGSWYIKSMNGSTILWNGGWGWLGVDPVAGDFNGDGIDDLAIFDQHTGRWFIRSVDGTQLAWSKYWGWPGVQPVAGDYNGDGESDLAIFDRESGRWFIKTLGGELLAWDVNWGWPGAEAVAGDYNGDGTSDLAVFDQASGAWYIYSLSGSTVLAWNIQWGWSGVKPVSGDFDGDGISDLAVFDDNTGRWFIRAMDGSIIGWDVYWGWSGVQPIGK